MKHLFPTPHEIPREHDRFEGMYPHCARLGIAVVDHGPGFDCRDVQYQLGLTRYEALMRTVKAVFCCNHDKYEAGHDFAGCEVHCIYADDLEVFLQSEAH